MSLQNKGTVIEAIKGAIAAGDDTQLHAILLTRELWSLDQGRWDEHMRVYGGLAEAMHRWSEEIEKIPDPEAKTVMSGFRQQWERIVFSVLDGVDFKTEKYKAMYEGVKNAAELEKSANELGTNEAGSRKVKKPKRKRN